MGLEEFSEEAEVLAAEEERAAALAEREGEEQEEGEELQEEEEVQEQPYMDPEEVIFGKRVPFSELGLESKPLLDAMPKLGFTGSTRVQSAAIPMVMSEERRAVVIGAETGSGKTLAFLLPAFDICLKNPRRFGSSCPSCLVLAPSKELGFQIGNVANQIAQAVEECGGRRISVGSMRRGWPSRVPDILITTPRAAAQGLEPCASEDEVTRREALMRIRNVEVLAFDEADLLLGGGAHTEDVKSVLVALSASFPDKPREVLGEAQIYHGGGVPVEVLDYESLEWRAGKAFTNANGTFNVCYGPGDWDDFVRRSQMRGPGMGLLVENGPRVVMSCATLPSFRKGTLTLKGLQDNKLFNSGIGSPDWVIKRWFPNAIRIQSKWIHRRHPCIVQQDWVYIEGERKRGNIRQLPTRIQKTVLLLREQSRDIRTLVFAYTPDTCLAAQLALKAEGIPVCGLHAAVPFRERIDGLKKFGRGEVSILICTDLAARGLDLPVCRHVVQLEMARNTVDHLHRVGRAARAGRLSKTTNYWGDGDVAVRDSILKAPAMGLDGELLCRRGNRGRLRRTRAKQRKQEHDYGEVRKRARLARARVERARARS